MKRIELLFIIVVLIFLSGCGCNKNSNEKYVNVSFDSNGGTVVENQIITKDNLISKPLDPVREGYTFVGWYIDDDVWRFNIDRVNNDINLIAKWSINQYTLRLKLNNGQSDIVIKQDYNTKITVNTPSKTGYSFKGWSSPIPELMPAENKTIEAQWTSNKYTLTLKYYYGKNDLIIEKDFNSNINVNTPKYAGYTFNGWSELIPEKMPANDLTIEAIWKCDVKYEIINDTVTITGINVSSIDELIILDNYDNKIVTSIKSNAFYYSSTNKGCNFSKLVIPDTVVTIGDYAFRHCEKLSYVKIGNSVTSIGSGAFYGCSSLTRIEIPTSVTSIGIGAFSHCSSLASIKIPNSVTSIGESAFYECSSLTSIEIPNSITTIGKSTFYNCSLLKSIEIPNSVTSIGDYAFSGCSLLTSVEIPTSILYLGYEVFKNCNRLNYYEDKNFYYLGSSSNPFLILMKTKFKNLSSFSINQNTKFIYSYAFASSSLSSIVLPYGVLCIGSYAFLDCEKLTNVSIPNSVTTIQEYAFKNCSSLTSISIPSSTSSVAWNILVGCPIVSATIPANVCSSLTKSTIRYLNITSGSTLLKKDFEYCKSLTSITIGDSVNSIEDYTFSYLENLQYVRIGNGVTSIGDGTFSHCSSLTSITIPNSVTSIGGYAFSNCSSLTSIVIPSGVTSIGICAFYCSSLTSITIPDSVTNIGDLSFWQCPIEYATVPAIAVVCITNSYTPPLKSLIITSGDVKQSMFLSSCRNLKFVGLHYGVTGIGYQAFSGCSSLTSIEIPNSVTSIGTEAFYDCSSLRSITIPDSVTSIGNRAFYRCSGLTSITIPNSVTSIGNYAFQYCYSLKSIEIPNSVTSIGEYAFYYCSSLQSITLPFVGDRRHTSTDPYQYPFGYIFGTSSYTYGIATTQYYYGSSTPSTTSSTYYIPITLKEVIITDCEYIQYGAFYNCSSLTSIEIPNSVTSIGGSAFYNCSSLTSIEIPNSVTSIGEYAFSGCRSLQSITLPFVGDRRHTSTDTYQYPFGYIFGTSSYTYGIATIQYYYGSSTSSTTTIYYIPSSLKEVIITDCEYIQYGAFRNCSSLTSIEIPNSVTNIGERAFLGCSSLTSIEIPNSVTSIGGYAFSNCSSLTSIEIPNSVTSIGIGAFNGCSLLQSITLPFVGDRRHISTDTYQYPFGYIFGTSSYTGGKDTIQKYFGSSIVNSTSTTYYIPEILNEVILSDCEYIPYGAFSNCDSLTNIEIPNSVTSIGESAFSGCSSLTSIEIPNSATSIGIGAFNGCSSLTSIIVDKDNPIYDSRDNCNAIIETNTNVLKVGCCNTIIPDNVTSIGESAFHGCKLIKNIDMPNSVSSIGNSAFFGCSALTSIEIPNSVISIGQSAFRNCSSLTCIEIPNSVTSIGEYAFSYCGSLQNTFYNGTELDWNNIIIGSNNGYLFNTVEYNSDIYILEYISNDNYSYVLSNDLYVYSFNIAKTNINITTFNFEEELNGLIIKSLGYQAFSGCSNLTSIEIPNSVTSIGGYAFYNCSSLTSIEIPNSVKSIGSRAFSRCSSLTSIEIPNSVTSIGEYAFSNCSSLTSIEIPNSVKSIGNNAFSECSSLTSIVIPNGVTSIGEDTFYNCKSLTSIVIPNSVKSIGQFAFYNCKSLTSIIIPNSVTKIDKWAFIDCSSLTSIIVDKDNPIYDSRDNCNAIIETNTNVLKVGCCNTIIPDSVTSIGNSAFYGCSSLTNVEMPNSIVSIGQEAFSKCSSLTNIEIPNSVTSIGNYAFSGCSSLTSIEIPNSVTSIGSNAFSGCSSLQSITLPFVGNKRYTSTDTYQYPFGYIFGTSSYTGGIATTQYYYGSSTSSTYYIPSSLKEVIITDCEYIQYGAFYNCGSLTSIDIQNSVTSIGDYAFYNCNNLKKIIIPGNVEQMGNSAFLNCLIVYIYCKAISEPSQWPNNWNYGRPVIWGYNE